MDIRGINYLVLASDLDKYHKDHPEQPCLGTEEASTRCTRGEYFVDDEQGYRSDYDKPKDVMGLTAERWWKFYDARPWLAGAYVWTGFDYRGEPHPYLWPVINCHFGIMDVCGFPKNNFYYYQAWWTDKDVLHLYPHWNWNGKTGDTINVWCQTNCQQVELFLNSKSQGTRQVAKDSHVEWNVVYEPGVLEAIGIRNGKKIIQKIETTGPSYRLVATTDRSQINADEEDICVVNISAVDDKDREVPTADDFIRFKIEGNGKIIGVGNGNPASHEPDKILSGNYYRRLFNGKCQVIVQASRKTGEIILTASSNVLRPAIFKIQTIQAIVRPYI
jgi:beta-galactosidase